MNYYLEAAARRRELVWKMGNSPVTGTNFGIGYRSDGGGASWVVVPRNGGSSYEPGMISKNGITFVAQAMTTPVNYREVVWSSTANIWAAVGDAGVSPYAMSSPDGITWTSRTLAALGWRSICVGGGKFVAVASNGATQAAYTVDGITWTAVVATAGVRGWNGVCYGGSLFVAVSSNGLGTGDRVMTSPDGITWTLRVSIVDNDWTDVCYGNGLFVAVSKTGTGDRVMTSPDGITWTSRTSAADNNWQRVVYGRGMFVAIGNSGTGNRSMYSLNGIDWVALATPADQNWLGIAYGDRRFVAVSADGATSRCMHLDVQ